jgi:hypothetical protein
MTISVLIEQSGNEFEASVVGVPALKAHGASKSEVIEVLRSQLARQVERGELITLELPQPGSIISQAGAYADDPMLADICRDAYAARDSERDALALSE